MIREIVAESGAKIDISDDGTVKIASANRESIEKALARIRGITSEPEVGVIYKGKVVKITDFGAFVNFFGAKDGLVHISQLNKGRPATVNEVVSEGQEVWVKLMGFDDRGKVRLSMKVVDQATGAETAARRRRRGRWRRRLAAVAGAKVAAAGAMAVAAAIVARGATDRSVEIEEVRRPPRAAVLHFNDVELVAPLALHWSCAEVTLAAGRLAVFYCCARRGTNDR